MKLYTYPLTSNAIKVSLLLNYLQLSFTEVLIQLPEGEQYKTQFKERNPNCSIPVLEDDGLIIWESNAILLHLQEKYGEEKAPNESIQKVQSMRWLCWQMGSWNKVVLPYAHQRVVAPFWGMPANENAIAEHADSLPKLAKILDTHLQQQRYLTGEQLDISDFSLAASLMFWQQAKIPLQEYPAILQWLAGLQASDWWQQSALQLDDFISSGSLT